MERTEVGGARAGDGVAVGGTDAARVRVEVACAPAVNFALQQNDVPVVREVVLANEGSVAVRDVTVEVSATGAGGPLCAPWTGRVSELAPGETARLTGVDLRLDAGRLANQTEREEVEVVAVVRGAAAEGGRAVAGAGASGTGGPSGGGAPGVGELGRAATRVSLLAFNEWPGVGILPEALAAFVTPNHPAVETLLGAVRDALGQATGDPSLAGYQSGGRPRAAATVAAVYEAMKAAGIGYVNPPASYEKSGQKVRTPAEVLEGSRLGTCLDLTVVAAAAIEQAGLHPLLLLVEGHAFVGAWLADETFAEPAVDDAGRIANRVRLGEVAVFETTALCAGKDVGFAAAQQLAASRLSEPEKFLLAVDVRAARRAGIRPLPARVRQGDGFAVVQQPAAGAALPAASAASPATPEADPPARRARTREHKIPDGLPAEAAARLEKWKRKLLDLSLRNPLLNFRAGGKKVIPLLAPDVAVLEDRLARGPLSLASRSGVLDPSGPRDASLEKARTGRDLPAEMLLEELKRGLVRADLGTAEFASAATELFRAGRTALEETGTNTLFLAIGSLVYAELGELESRRVAPLVLVPVRLERPGPGFFRLTATDEECRVNVTLLEKLARDFGVDPAPLYEVGADEAGFDVAGALRAFAGLVKDLPRCEVRDSAHVGLFSFAKFLLYADLDERLAAVAAAPVVKQILDRAARADDGTPFPREEELDLRGGAAEGVCPMDADSSQAAAVCAALAGKSFVLQGPPGTGKSQTITNLIARAAHEGKRVLFVAEKQAALDVVRRRLDKAGLGPFVLEVHSNKAGKKEVLNQLRTALESASARPPEAWEAEVAKLHRTRDRLNGYVRALHEMRASGETVFVAAARLGALSGAARVPLVLPRPAETTRERLEALREAVARAAVAAREVGDPSNHPLKGVRLREWRPDLADLAEDAIGAVRSAVEGFGAALVAWLGAMGLEPETASRLTTSEVKPLLAAAKLARPQRWSARTLLAERDWPSLTREVTELARTGRERDALRAWLLDRYTPTYLTIDHARVASELAAASSAFFLVRWLRRRKVLAPVRAATKTGRLPPHPEVATDLAKAASVTAMTARLKRTDTPSSAALGPLLRDGEADWDAAEAAVAAAGELRKLVAAYPQKGAVAPERFRDAVADLLDADPLRLEPGGAARAAAEAFVESAGKVHAALPGLLSLLDSGEAAVLGSGGQPFLPTLAATLNSWSGALVRLPEWCAWQREFRRDDVPELRDLLDALGAGTLPADAASAAFEAAYAKLWLGAVMSSEPALRDFRCEQWEGLIAEFSALDVRVQELSRRVIAAELASRVPRATSSASANSEAGILRRQLQLQRNHKPVRKLVQELPTLLPRLKPVWLMSPLSVATYLDPTVPPFDLVVFDEASQIPVWDAVGAVARGARAVVVGDSKQLPPTDFFQRQSAAGEGGEAADDAEVEELESILDECVASDLPELRLKWHYRSRHESLIAFSNAQYYDGQLLTFPSADDRPERLGVSMRRVEGGRYDRGGSRTNRREAEAVIDELCARAAAGDARSVGVVTFSSAQQMLIEDLFDERCRTDARLQDRYRGGDEPLFIKNLENVQGDERDVILFSICYGPDESGRVSLGFGPLNRDGGERRLNVAVTRARQQVIVFCSLRADQIDLNRSRSKGLAHLRLFLDYAERGSKALAEAVTPGGQADWESPFEKAVCKELRDRGYTVHTQVGCSAYRIDLAVVDPERPGRYLLGVECDGASYHSAKTARDRDRLRQQVLEQLGWTLHRVWSTDWLQNRERAVARLLAAIDAAKTKAAVAAERARPLGDVGPATSSALAGTADIAPTSRSEAPGARLATVDQESPAVRAAEDGGGALFADAGSQLVDSSPSARPYALYDFPYGARGAEAFYLSRADRRLADELRGLVHVEGPVHAGRAYSCVARAWGLQRVTSRVTQRLDDVLESVVDVERRGEFLWPPGMAQGPLGHYRVPVSGGGEDDTFRTLDEIAAEEVAAAVGDVLDAQLGLPLADLERAVAQLFGVRRVTAPARQRVGEAAGLLEGAGRCRTDGGIVRSTV